MCICTSMWVKVPRKARRGHLATGATDSSEQLQQQFPTWGLYSQKYKLKRPFPFLCCYFGCCCFSCFVAPRLEPEASHMLGTWSPTEHHFSSLLVSIFFGDEILLSCPDCPQLAILPPQTQEIWDQRHVPPGLGLSLMGIKHRVKLSLQHPLQGGTGHGPRENIPQSRTWKCTFLQVSLIEKNYS